MQDYIIYWLCGGNLILLIIEYVFLIAVWKIGIHFIKKTDSLAIKIVTWLVGLFSLLMTANLLLLVFICPYRIDLHQAAGGYISCFVFPLFLSFMNKTIAITFDRQEKPLAYAKIAIGLSLLIVLSHTIAALIG